MYEDVLGFTRMENLLWRPYIAGMIYSPRTIFTDGVSVDVKPVGVIYTRLEYEFRC